MIMNKCIVCRRVFVGQKHNANKFCSYACYHQSRWPKESRKFIKIDGVWYKGRCGDCGKPVKGQYAKRCFSCYQKTDKQTFAKLDYSGSKHWNWKGGITDENHRIRTSADMKAWRKAVFERDNYTCVLCGQYGGKLNADHIKPFALYPQLRLELSNGRTLCFDCHRKTETWGRSVFNLRKGVVR